MKWLAQKCMSLAAQLLRKDRGEWADAMRAEYQHLSDDRERRRWAFGCLTTAVKHRYIPMDTGTLRLSRWVLLLELMLCFTPATIGWLDLTFGHPGVVRLNGPVIDKYFLAVPGDTYVLFMMFAGVVVGLIGPIGLFLALRYLLLGRALRSHRLGLALIAGPVIATAVAIVARAFMGLTALQPTIESTVLFLFLPAAGVAHLMHLAGNGERTAPAAVTHG